MQPFNIVLVAPEIPQNTGTIGRLCVSTETRLHLVRPLGFSLEDKYVKRAGMDYWPHLDLTIYENWEEFLKRIPKRISCSSPQKERPASGMRNTVPATTWCSAGSRAGCRRNFTTVTVPGFTGFR